MIVKEDIRLSAAVMTHPSRRDAAEALRDRHPGLDLQVVVDPRPDRPTSCVDNSRRAWGTAAPDATHHLVLQDDARLAADFTSQLLAAIAERPRWSISLFTEWGSQSSYAIRLAALMGARWAPVLDPYVPTVGHVLPVTAARAHAAGVGAVAPQDDVVLYELLRDLGVPMCLAVPNLVEHTGGPSLTGNEAMGVRHAAYFADAHRPAAYGATGVALPLDLPYYDTQRASTASAIYEVEKGEWTTSTFADYMTRNGLDRTQILAIGASAVDAAHACLAFESARDAEHVLQGLRVVTYAMGHLTGRLGHAGSQAGRPALDTMAPGALRWWLADEDYEAIREPFAVVLADAVERGYLDGLAVREGLTGGVGLG